MSSPDTPRRNSPKPGQSKRRRASKSIKSLRGVIQNEKLLKGYKEYCEQTYCSEAIAFYCDVAQFNKLSAPEQIREKSLAIYQQYFSVEAEHGLGSVSAQTKIEIYNALSDPKPGMFDEIQNKIFLEMAITSLPEFMKSLQYKQLLASSLTPYDELVELLQKEPERNLFYSYLRTAFAAEGFECWIKIQSFKAVTSEEERYHLAKEIINTYLASDGTSPLSGIPTTLLQELSNLDAVLERYNPFEGLETTILRNLSQGLFKDFLESEFYANQKALLTGEIPLTPGRSLRQIPTPLFQPFVLNGLMLKNRLGCAPMQHCKYTNGRSNDWLLVHMGSVIVGGVGFACVEPTAVLPEGRQTLSSLGLWNNEQLEDFTRITRFAKEQGTVIGIQLTHAGRKASVSPKWSGKYCVYPDNGGWTVFSSTDKPYSQRYPCPERLTIEQIDKIVEAFAAAATRAVQAGFDFIEINAARGHLIHQFLTPLVNDRTDEYGGSLENRMLICIRIAKAVRAVVPFPKLVFFRVCCSDWKTANQFWDLGQCFALVQQLRMIGVDAIVCSSGGAVERESLPHKNLPLECTRKMKQRSRMIIIADSNTVTGSEATSILEEGVADLVYISKPLLKCPNWALHVAEEVEDSVFWAPTHHGALQLASRSCAGKPG